MAEIRTITNISEIRRNIDTFNEQARQFPDRARVILRTTKYWVSNPERTMFGPSKFIGLAAMTFPKYDRALQQLDEGAFDGGRTHAAIERLLDSPFSDDEGARTALGSWGEALLGPDAFGGADAAKWQFLTLPRRRNPDWQRDELILALDLYIRAGRRVLDDSDPEVIALSELLNHLPIHSERPDAGRFRNPNGVALKLANFRAIDQPGHGMSGGGKLDQAVWSEFSGDESRLRALAVAIAEGSSEPDAEPESIAEADEDELGFPEGRIIYRLHRARERNADLVRRKKKAVLRQHGRLACEACGFDFAVRYGVLGDGFIECHHARPLSELGEPSVTRLDDLVIVCSNCHRMIHRRRPWLGVSELRAIVAQVT